ncbi:MAG: prolipoprotein diacylglyceryl transferase family protein [Chloroflexota bacterium]
MLPFLNLFGVAIAFPPLVLILGIWLGANLSEKHAAKHGISGDQIFNLIFTGLAAYIVGGRLSYAAQHPSAFSDNLLSIFSRNFGLFDPLGGFVIGLIAIVIYGQRKKLAAWQTLDAITPALAVVLLALPLANLASGEAFGAVSELPWAIELWGATRHPVQLYEALAAGLILWQIWPGRIQKGETAGLEFLRLLSYSAFARLLFEGFRGSSVAVSSLNLRVAQLAAWLTLAGALWLYHSRKTRPEVKNGKS